MLSDDAPPLVAYERRGCSAWVTLDSQPNRNALSAELLEQLTGRLEEAFTDDAVRVVVLTHAGTVFCSGADLRSPMPAGAFTSLLGRLWNAPKPVISRVDGKVRAGGVGLAAACDLVACSTTSSFALPEVRIGVIPAVVSLIVLPRCGVTRSLELFLTAGEIHGARAVEIGLATAAAEDVDALVDRYVEQLASGAPGALAAAARLAKPALDFSAVERQSLEFFASDEAREGMTAFREKRPPRWAS